MIKRRKHSTRPALNCTDVSASRREDDAHGNRTPQVQNVKQTPEACSKAHVFQR